MTKTIPIVYPEPIEKKIYVIRGHRVMIDSDLADLYEVETRALNQAVKRNPKRFPVSFMFQLSREEEENLKSQFVISRSENEISKAPWGGRRKSILAFTEHGVLMLASVLKSNRAIDISIQIVETFVRLRQMVLSVPDLAKRLEQIEARLAGNEMEINAFRDIVFPLLTSNLPPTRRKAGFNPEDKK